MRAMAAWLGAAGLVLAAVPERGAAQVVYKPSGARTIEAGVAAPEIELATLTGGRVKLSSLRGHPVVITFWGTWCPPCRDEFPELVAAHRKYRADGLEILAVNQRDQEISTRDVEAFAEEFGVDFTVALDPRGRSRRNYRLIALPTTVFIDSAGTIRTVHPGPINARQLAEGIAGILPRE
jgi:thiol-disulfide isomerase/thioredoxin